MKAFRVLIYVFFAVLIFGVSTAGCKEDMAVYKDASNPIEVNAGEEFSIILESNHSAGYSWKFAKPFDADILEFEGSEYKLPKNGRIGANGNEVWIFKGINKGKTILLFKYVRPWEKDKYPLKSRTFIIIVK